jgi:hypothetical protein
MLEKGKKFGKGRGESKENGLLSTYAADERS